MNALSLYAPLIGLLLAIFGMIRVLMRSGVDFGRGVNLQTEEEDTADRAALWRALSSPAGRVDLLAFILGVATLVIFIGSIS